MPIHNETRQLPYSAQAMYDLVADVDKYPEFIPWIVAARVRSRKPFDDGEVMRADLVVGFKMFRERFGSKVTLWPDWHRIDTEYVDGPFKHMISTWEFVDTPDGCEVKFHVDFEFKSRLLRGAAGMFFFDAMQRVVRAFETRAHQLYGNRGAAQTA